MINRWANDEFGDMKGERPKNIDTDMVRIPACHKFYEVYSGQSTTTEAVPVNISGRVKGSPQKEFKTACGKFIILI